MGGGDGGGGGERGITAVHFHCCKMVSECLSESFPSLNDLGRWEDIVVLIFWL